MTTKVAVYSLSDLKNTTDDALPTYLTSLKFTRSHLLTDIRLGLGYTAVSIAAITFYADYKLGWDATRTATLWAVLAYFLINGCLTVWIWGVEKGKVFVGEKGNGLITIASHSQKYDPTYRLTINISTSRTAKPKTMEISSPFTRWFDSDGFFVAKPFQQWLASEVAMVGEADPKNAEAAKKIREGFVELMDGDRKVGGRPVADGEGGATGNETVGKKARERSKKSKA